MLTKLRKKESFGCKITIKHTSQNKTDLTKGYFSFSVISLLAWVCNDQ